MSRLTVLQAIQTILETQFDRVYIYPDEFADVDNTLPFLILEELPVNENNTTIRAADWIDVDWTVGLYGFYALEEFPSPSTEDAAAKAAALTGRDTVRGLLEANMQPAGVSKPIGDDRRTFTDILTPLQWRVLNKQKPAYGFYFEIPVTSG